MAALGGAAPPVWTNSKIKEIAEGQMQEIDYIKFNRERVTKETLRIIMESKRINFWMDKKKSLEAFSYWRK